MAIADLGVGLFLCRYVRCPILSILQQLYNHHVDSKKSWW